MVSEENNIREYLGPFEEMGCKLNWTDTKELAVRRSREEILGEGACAAPPPHKPLIFTMKGETVAVSSNGPRPSDSRSVSPDRCSVCIYLVIGSSFERALVRP